MVATTPSPFMFLNLTSLNFSSFSTSAYSCFVLATIAFASGCSLDASHRYKMVTNSSKLSFSYFLYTSGSSRAGLNFYSTSIRSLTEGVPAVSVPVLSKTTVVMPLIFSRTSPPLIRQPKEAAIPVPTITAVGVAKPKAHGQAITKVETPKLNAKTNLVCPPRYSYSCPDSE